MEYLKLVKTEPSISANLKVAAFLNFAVVGTGTLCLTSEIVEISNINEIFHMSASYLCTNTYISIFSLKSFEQKAILKVPFCW